jgi:hypothetical protein
MQLIWPMNAVLLEISEAHEICTHVHDLPEVVVSLGLFRNTHSRQAEHWLVKLVLVRFVMDYHHGD